MSKTKEKFEDLMQELEIIVTRLEQGDVALEEALKEFQKGMALSKELQERLNKAEKTLVALVQADGTEVEFEGQND